MIKTKKKYLLFVILALLLFVVLIFVGLYFDGTKVVDSIRISVSTSNQDNDISIYRDNKECFLFLPSHAEKSNCKLKFDSNYRLYIDDKEIKPNETIKNFDSEKSYSLEIKNLLGMSVSKYNLTFMKSANVPSMMISLKSGTIIDLNKSKDKELSADMTIINYDGALDYSGKIDKISGRGNSSWSHDKKPYKFSLKKDGNLLNMGEAKNWCLLANYYDESHMRNKLVYDSAKKIGLKYTPDSEWVDLYVDGDYLGLYLLTEKVEVGENRVKINDLQQQTQALNTNNLKSYDKFSTAINGIDVKAYDIPNNPEDITGGYLIEFAVADRIEDNSFITNNNQLTLIDYPKYSSYNQAEYISDFINNVEKDIYSYGSLDNIDLDSFVKYYLIQEYFGNGDINSFFFYKDSDSIDPKLYAGPIWDFDLSMGAAYLGKDANPEVFYTNTWGWFEKLYKNEKFYKRVKEIYYEKEFESLINDLDTQIDIYAEIINKSWNMDFKRWDYVEKEEWYTHAGDLNDNSNYLKNFLSIHRKFIENAFDNDLDIKRLIFRSDLISTSKYNFSVKSGETFENPPILENDEWNFVGWFEKNTGEKFDPAKPVEKSEVYIAKWEAKPSERSIFDKIKNNLDLLICVGLFGTLLMGLCVFAIVELIRKRRAKNE